MRRALVQVLTVIAVALWALGMILGLAGTAYLDGVWSLMTNPTGSAISSLIIGWPLLVPAVIVGGLAALLNRGQQQHDLDN
jgi:hypothetical protein